MDFVDLDKVLDDFEEDEERISVCVVENESNANGFLHRDGNSTTTYSISIEDKYSNVPYPQQVSNELPTPDSPLYNNVTYGVPFKVTDNLTLSDADFGFSDKISRNLKANNLEEVKEEKDSEDNSPDGESLGQLLQNNGVLEIRDVQVNHPTCSTLPSGTGFPQAGYYYSVVTNFSPHGSSISTDSGSVQNLDSGNFPHIEKFPSVENHSDFNQLNSDSEKSTPYYNLTSSTTESPDHQGLQNGSTACQSSAAEPTSNGGAWNSISNSTSCENNVNHDVVGFESVNDNMSDVEIMAYLDQADGATESDVKMEPEEIIQEASTPEQHVSVEQTPGNDVDVVMENMSSNDMEDSPGLPNQLDDLLGFSMAKESMDTPFSMQNESVDQPNPENKITEHVTDNWNWNDLEETSNLLLKPIDQEESTILNSINSEPEDVVPPTHTPIAFTQMVSENNEQVAATELPDADVIPGLPGATGCASEEGEVPKRDHSTEMVTSPAQNLHSNEHPEASSGESVGDAVAVIPRSGCPDVKPKEPQKLKRPSSLLGLSTVSLQPVINVPKSQSLPRSFALGATETGNNVKKMNKTLDSLPTNSCQEFSSSNSNISHESDNSGQANNTGVEMGLTDNSDMTAVNTAPETASRLSAMQEEPVAGIENAGSEQAMQTSLPKEVQPQTRLPRGAPNMSREGRPESLNLPPFLGFPSHLPDTNSLDSSHQGRPVQSTDTTDGPPSYLDLEDSGSDAGAVGGAPAHPRQTLGNVAPVWVPDAEAPNCMQCESKFTFTKRRHHCRACGKVFCSSCCNLKCKLEYMGSKEARVCVACHEAILSAQNRSGPADRSPNPNNPSEYCSTIPPHQQANAHTPAPTVLVPVGVLKREGSHRRGEPKQVMFSDGIRPGGDLTESEAVTEARLPQRSGRKVHKVERTSASSAEGQSAGAKMKQVKVTESSRWSSLIPAVGLPPLVVPALASQDDAIYTNPTDEKVMQQIKGESAEPVVFQINANLQCRVSMINLDCCVHRQCWCFTSKGLCTVGQDEVVIVLEYLPDETTIPIDIFHHLQALYEAASKGNTVSDMGHSIFCQSFLGSKDHGGFLYIRPSFQCLLKMSLPSPPYVFGILLQKWEIPWAKVFPIRLLLRLGAEYRYYPCPLISIRNRKPVFFEIGHTIMNLLADFRGYQYMLPQVKGLLIHMEDKKTVINFPRNRYQDLMKVVTGSNEHVMALGANFSMEADSHLVCIQNDDGNYQTQAINIQNKPRKVTGASFVVFNGALKTASGLTAKSSIVEDGLMVQIPPDSMAALKQSIKDMKNYSIACGSVGSAKPDEVITIQWVEDDKTVNLGVKSPVDSMGMDGIESLHIHNGTDYLGENKVIRWTEVFFIQNKDSSAKLEPIDLSRLAESLAQAGCIALTPHLDHLSGAGLTKIGLRATIHSESVGYDVGSNGEKLPDMYMNDLDNELIPVIHNAASLNQEGPITLELIFYILN